MEHKGNQQGNVEITNHVNIAKAKAMSFNDWIDLLFEDWFAEYCKQNSTNCRDMRGPLHRAFKQGWLACENFYS